MPTKLLLSLALELVDGTHSPVPKSRKRCYSGRRERPARWERRMPIGPR